MGTHFHNFNAEAMRAFGEQLAKEADARGQFLRSTRDGTFAMLAGFRKHHQEAERERRHRADQSAGARHDSMSQMRAGVREMKGRFEQGRKARADDLGQMASELRAACEAFRNRPRRK